MRIAIHAFEGISTFHLAAPLLVFGEVTRQGLAEGWSTALWTLDGRPVRSAEGFGLSEVHGPELAVSADLLVLPSWTEDFRPPEPELVEVIRSAHAAGAACAGFCLGAFPLAGSGLLDGRVAATHWAAAAALAARYPAVEVRSDALYQDHGDVLTSAGTASALDACLHLVRERLGTAAAAAIARHIVVAPHREGSQAQYIRRPLASYGDTPLGGVIDWALANLDRRLSVEELAGRARMSPRNFTRRFRETTGSTPARWILARRLDEARGLLESTDWSIARIAAVCGFASAVTFRQNFAAHYATSPTSYRRRFADGPGRAGGGAADGR